MKQARITISEECLVPLGPLFDQINAAKPQTTGLFAQIFEDGRAECLFLDETTTKEISRILTKYVNGK